MKAARGHSTPGGCGAMCTTRLVPRPYKKRGRHRLTSPMASCLSQPSAKPGYGANSDYVG